MARIINEHFVAVKVDRDERPDVDTRYQAAVSAISGQGGWPLTAFLTPDGRPYFGGTYFRGTIAMAVRALAACLLTMSQVWKERRNEALESAASVMAAIEHNESFSSRNGELSPGLSTRLSPRLSLSLIRAMAVSARSPSFRIPRFSICFFRQR